MEELKEYLVLAVSIAAVMGILGALSHPNFAAEARLALGVISLLALLAPIVALFSSRLELPVLDDLYLPEYGDGYIEVTALAYEQGLRRAVSEQIGVEEENVLVELGEVDFQSMRVCSLTVILGAEAILSDTRSLREWLKDNFLIEGGICKVVIRVE